MDIFYQYLNDINPVSTAFRLFLAVLLGGIIGLERGANKHPAGFRTHILVCVGATLAMVTNQYIFENMTAIADPSRMGAQVITGVGFLGVGTIMVTGGQKIKGLTTAAGLWASACIGLAIGIGFYYGAAIAAFFVFMSLTFLRRIEIFFYELSPVMDLYVELDSLPKLREFQNFVRSKGIIITSSHFNKAGSISSDGIGFHMSIKMPKGMKHADVIEILGTHEGLYIIEEI